MAYPSDLVRTKNWGSEILTDEALEGQFDVIITWVDAFADETSGHDHTGGANKGPKIDIADALTVTSQAQGDVIYASSGSAWARLGAGTAGQALTTAGAAANPTFAGMTTQGDIEYRDATTRQRLAKGTANQVLRMNSGATAPEWAKVDYNMLNVTTGLVGVSTNNNGTLPGGQYAFYPQVKQTSYAFDDASTFGFTMISCNDPGSSYVTLVGAFAMSGGSGTFYFQSTYVTASGSDYWLFLLVNRETEEVTGVYAAPDHPCYGNGGDWSKLTHPFHKYNSKEQQVVVVDYATVKDILKTTSPDEITDVLESDYRVDLSKRLQYTPLHSGLFTYDGKKSPVMVEYLPEDIGVVSLAKLSDADKKKRVEIRQKQYEDVMNAQKVRAEKLASLKSKLNISDEELALLTGKYHG